MRPLCDDVVRSRGPDEMIEVAGVWLAPESEGAGASAETSVEGGVAVLGICVAGVEVETFDDVPAGLTGTGRGREGIVVGAAAVVETRGAGAADDDDDVEGTGGVSSIGKPNVAIIC